MVYYGCKYAGSSVFFEIQLSNNLAGRGRGPKGRVCRLKRVGGGRISAERVMVNLKPGTHISRQQ